MLKGFNVVLFTVEQVEELRRERDEALHDRDALKEALQSQLLSLRWGKNHWSADGANSSLFIGYQSCRSTPLFNTRR